ncbi:transcriptional regulator GlxA family with amidase domain [Pseudomonas migulae]|nr:transcriptional regulator GlxA family with amidase domain [Pseudomonas migulae]
MFGNSIVPDYHEWIALNLSHDNLTVEVLRLEAARRLLEESEHNIEQIARGCGFGMRSGCGLRFSAIWSGH